MSPAPPVRYTPEETAAERPLDLMRTMMVVEERFVVDRLSHLASAARRESDAAERAISGVIMDTLEEREEIARIFDAWCLEQGVQGPGEPHGRSWEFRDLVQSLLELKRSFARRYRALAAACPDPEMAKRLHKLGERSAEHAAILLGLAGDG